MSARLKRSKSFRLQTGLVAFAAAGATAWLALNDGSYDVVPRQTAGLILWWIVALTMLIGRRPVFRPGRAGSLVVATILASAIWVAVGLDGTISTERTAIEVARAVMHVAPVVLIGLLLPARMWMAALGGVIVAMVAVCAVGLADRLSPGAFGQTATVVFSNTNSRLSAPIGYWNALGSWSVITASLLLAVSSHIQVRAIRALALAAVPIAVATGYVTYSRSAVGAAVFAIALLIALAQNRWTAAVHVAAGTLAGGAAVLAIRAAKAIADGTGSAGSGTVVTVLVVGALALAAFSLLTRRLDGFALPVRVGRPLLAGAAVVIVVASCVGAATKGHSAWNQFKDTGSENIADPASRLTTLHSARYPQWMAALDEYERHPWRGSGAGTFELTYNVYPKSEGFVKDAHNAFLEAMSEQGLPGLILLVGFLISTAATVVVARRRNVDVLARGLIAGAGAGIGVFTFGTAIDWLWEVTALAFVALALTGAMVAAGRPQVDEGPGDAAPRAPVAIRPILFVVAVLAMLVELPGLVGTSDVRRSQNDVARHDIPGARAEADQAIDTMPWASSAYLQRALVDEQAGAFASSRRSLQLAIQRDPHDWRLPLVLARVEAKAGAPAAALAAYRTAKALRPHGEFFN